jgi:hypothetical protein
MTSESLAGSPIRKEIVSSFGSLSQLNDAVLTQIGPEKSPSLLRSFGASLSSPGSDRGWSL